jgi:hypothetical protein
VREWRSKADALGRTSHTMRCRASAESGAAAEYLRLSASALLRGAARRGGADRAPRRLARKNPAELAAFAGSDRVLKGVGERIVVERGELCRARRGGRRRRKRRRRLRHDNVGLGGSRESVRCAQILGAGTCESVTCVAHKGAVQPRRHANRARWPHAPHQRRAHLHDRIVVGASERWREGEERSASGEQVAARGPRLSLRRRPVLVRRCGARDRAARRARRRHWACAWASTAAAPGGVGPRHRKRCA